MMFDPEKITFFAKTDARGQQVPFGIRAKDRQRHMYVVGKTGMGKSTMLENMAVQDIQNGEGMAFIDPHGSAAEILLDYIPEHRVNDVVYFAPFDLENPISFNVMEDVGVEKRHLVVSGLMSTFKKIWVDAWSARMEYILTNALLVLIEYPDTTLLSVNRLFNDKAYRLKVVDACQDPAVKSFWVDEFANYTERFAADALPAIQNKIGQFTGNPLIRNIIGQPHSSFDFREMMDQKKIVIMNLSKGLIGETNANLLGSMLTTRIYLAAMSRANLPVAEMKQMPNFYFYVDEFQSFANATFANILSEARKYHLNLIIAHQYIEQMEEEVRDAVFGNVGTTVAFRVGPFDAETLETVFTPRFLAADLVNLGFTQIYLTLMIDGIGSQPFSAVTLPSIAPPRSSCKQMVIAASRRNYTSDRAVVEKLVADLHNPTPPPPKAEKKVPGGTNQTTPASVAYKTLVMKPPVSDTTSSSEKKTPAETGGTRSLTSMTAVSERRSVVTVTDTKDIRPITNETNKTTTAPVVPVAVKTDRPLVVHTSSSFDRTRTQKDVSRGIERGSYSTPKKSPLGMVASTPRQKPASTEDLRTILAKIAKEAAAPVLEAKPNELVHNAESVISPLKAALGALNALSNDTTLRELPPRPTSVSNLVTTPQVQTREQQAIKERTDSTQERLQSASGMVSTSFTQQSLDPKQIARLLKAPAHDKSPF